MSLLRKIAEYAFKLWREPKSSIETCLFHGARHHFDETLAETILRTALPNHKLICTRDLEQYLHDPSVLIGDVGGQYDGKRFFDHHQEGSPRREVMIEGKKIIVPYSASSLIWLHFGKEYLRKLFPDRNDTAIDFIHQSVEKNFLAIHDIWDNGFPPEIFERMRKGETIQGVNTRLFKAIESFNPTFLEMSISDRANLHKATREPDMPAQEKEFKAFRMMCHVMQYAFPIICKEAAQSVTDGKESFNPVPAIKWLCDIPTWKEIMDFSIKEWEPVAQHSKLRPIQKIIFKRNGVIARSRDRNVINSYARNIRSAADMTKKWKPYFRGMSKDTLERIAFIIGKKDQHEAGHYYFPWNYVTEAIADFQEKFDVAIAPSTDGGWVAIPAYTKNRLRFPKICGGAHGEELLERMSQALQKSNPKLSKKISAQKEKLTQNGDSCFCHKAGFLMAARDLPTLMLLVHGSMVINERVQEQPRGYDLTQDSPEVRRRVPPRTHPNPETESLLTPKNYQR
ncbi:MAG: MYG1 family protein [Verrucomicrobiota bacterium]